MTTTKTPPTKPTITRLKPDVRRKMEAAAEADNRSLSSMISVACTVFLAGRSA